MFGLPCHPKREKPALPHSMVMKVDFHSACMRLFAIWLVTMKYITTIKTQNSKLELPWYLRSEKPALLLQCLDSVFNTP